MMDISKLYLLLVALLNQAEAETEVSDQGDFLDDVQAMPSWLLGYGKESKTVFKIVVRESRALVGEWIEQLKDTTVDILDATVEFVKDGIKDAASEVEEVHNFFTSDFDTASTNVDTMDDLGINVGEADIDTKFVDLILSEGEIVEDTDTMVEEIGIIMEEEDTFENDLYEVFEVIQTRSELIAQAVTDIYNGMTSDDDNFRFDLILDQITPDLSPYYYLCPNLCSTCNLTMPEMMCRICCPDMFSDPISFTDIFMENSYSAMVTSWVQSSFSWSGLQMVYQNWIQENNREQHAMASRELSAYIRNFNWLQKVMKGAKFNSSLPAVSVLIDDSQEEVLSDDVCGYYENGLVRRPEGRIMGGEEVDRMRLYPWQMSLATGFMGMFYQHRCGAALLSSQWVMTAAHCLHTLQGQTLYVMGGFLDINKKETAQVRKVEAYINHENFMPILYEQDISLLRLSSPIVYTPSLLPVCLPRPGVSYSAHLGLTAVLTGWGRQWDEGPLSSQLEMVELPVISNTECMDWYNRSGSRQFIPEHTFLCAGWEEGAMDACSGDSGGPLVVTRRDGRAEVIGIVSWGIGCGVKGRPGVYTRVSQYVPWIESKIREYQETI